MGNAYLEDAYEDLVYKHSDWKKTAEDYEAGFAQNLSNDPIVKETARGVLTKLSKMLNSYYDVQKLKTEHPEEVKRGDFSALYGLATERAGGEAAGKIGGVLEEEARQQNQEIPEEVLNGEGSLKERMAVLYNSFLVNGGQTGKEVAASRSFKNMMANITSEDVLMMRYEGAPGDDAETLGLNPNLSVIEEQHAHKYGGDITDTSNVAYGVAKARDKQKGRGNIFSRFFQGIIRVFREGPKTNHRQEPVTAEKMLSTAGTSATAMRMLAAYRMMGADKKDLLYFRLALIGWMCSSRQHSLLEILKGSHNAGVRGYEDLRDPASMYASVDPLSPTEIRENYAPNREYPQETIYKKILQDAVDARREKVYKRDRQDIERSRGTGYDYEKELTELRRTFWQVKKQEEKGRVLEQERRQQRGELRELKAKLEVKRKAGQGQQGNEEIKALEDAIAEKQALVDELNERVKAADAKIKEVRDPMEKRQAELQKQGFGVELDLDAYGLFSERVADQTSWEASLRTDTANAQDLALNIYTTSAFKVINNSQKYGSLVGNYIMYNYTDPSGDAFRNSKAEELKDGALMKKVLAALRLSNRIAQDALTERGSLTGKEAAAQMLEEETDSGAEKQEKQTGREVLRGGKTPSALYGKAGDTFVTESLTSTSKNIYTADLFYIGAAGNADQNGYYGKQYEQASIMEFHLKNICGLEISNVSKYKEEAETLIPANVAFKIVQPLQEKVYDGKELHPLEKYSPDMIESIRNRENGNYRLRKHVVVEAIEDRNTKFSGEKYQKQRVSRNEKKRMLQERLRQFELLKERRRETAGAQ